jgi:hypothetical protein
MFLQGFVLKIELEIEFLFELVLNAMVIVGFLL